MGRHSDASRLRYAAMYRFILARRPDRASYSVDFPHAPFCRFPRLSAIVRGCNRDGSFGSPQQRLVRNFSSTLVPTPSDSAGDRDSPKNDAISSSPHSTKTATAPQQSRLESRTPTEPEGLPSTVHLDGHAWYVAQFLWSDERASSLIHYLSLGLTSHLPC